MKTLKYFPRDIILLLVPYLIILMWSIRDFLLKVSKNCLSMSCLMRSLASNICAVPYY